MTSYTDQFLVRSRPTLPTSCPTRDPSTSHTDPHSMPYSAPAPIRSLRLPFPTPRGAPNGLKHHLRPREIRQKSIRREVTRV